MSDRVLLLLEPSSYIGLPMLALDGFLTHPSASVFMPSICYILLWTEVSHLGLVYSSGSWVQCGWAQPDLDRGPLYRARSS